MDGRRNSSLDSDASYVLSVVRVDPHMSAVRYTSCARLLANCFLADARVYSAALAPEDVAAVQRESFAGRFPLPVSECERQVLVAGLRPVGCSSDG